MRPANTLARQQLQQQLARRAGQTVPQMAAQLGVSADSVQRMLREQGALHWGRARASRHALPRALRGSLEPLPLYAVNEVGQAQRLGTLQLLRPEGSLLCWQDSAPWLCAGLPYPLYDLAPQGYLGRQFARAHALLLGLPPDPRAWGDDDIAWGLSRAGADLPGNWILGQPALQRWQQAQVEPVGEAELPAHYARCAEAQLQAGEAGSSAAGEFPKFCTARQLAGSRTPHVLVKFAPLKPAARWADLLLAEHLCLQALAAHGHAAAASRLIDHGGRRYLELERFDRHGLRGRSPLVSLSAVAGAWGLDIAAPWPRQLQALQRQGVLSEATLQQAAQRWAFGRLTANSDMHAGNLSLRPAGPGFELAPAYDMLPMAFAPLANGELPRSLWQPPADDPDWAAAFTAARQIARHAWQQLAQDPRASPWLRTLALNTLDAL